MSRKYPKTNEHHKVGVCNHKRFKVEADTNKMIVDLFQHRSWNNIWNDKQDLQSQLEEIKDKRYA